MERLAWIEILDRHGDVSSRHPVHGWPMRVGRAYDCDLVLDDPYVAASHLEIQAGHAGAYQLHATGSLNGLKINAQRDMQTEATVAANDVVRIGQTQLRIRPVDYPVPAEKPLSSKDWLRSRTALFVGVVGLLLVQLFTHWLDYSRDEAYSIMLLPILGGIPVFLMWIGFWALIGRVLSGHANFVAHANTVLLGMASLLFLDSLLYGYVDFAFDTSLMSNVVSEATGPLIMGAILYRHISLVSRMGRRRLGMMVAGLMACLVGFIHLNEKWTEDDDLNRMTFSRTIGPAALLLRHGQIVEQFMLDADKLKTRADK